MSLFSKIESLFSKPISFRIKPAVEDDIRTFHVPLVDIVSTSGEDSGTLNVPTAALPVSIEELSACLEVQNRRYDRELTI